MSRIECLQSTTLDLNPAASGRPPGGLEKSDGEQPDREPNNPTVKELVRKIIAGFLPNFPRTF